MNEDYEFEIEFYESVLRRDPKDVVLVELLASLYTKTGQIDAGLKMDRKLVRLQPENPIAHYNLSCSLALKNRRADAVRALREAIENGYSDWEWLMKDPDLKVLQGYAKFQELLSEYRINS